MARENHPGDVHFSNPYLVKVCCVTYIIMFLCMSHWFPNFGFLINLQIRHSRWPTKIVTFSNSRLPNVELYAYHIHIYWGKHQSTGMKSQLFGTIQALKHCFVYL
jgi:hypothetical protein